MDGDHRIDIVTANKFGRSATILSNMTEFPRAAFAFDRFKLSWLYEASVFGVADFNQDGHADVVYTGDALHVFISATAPENLPTDRRHRPGVRIASGSQTSIATAARTSWCGSEAIK